MVKQWRDPAGGVALETDLEDQNPFQSNMLCLAAS